MKTFRIAINMAGAISAGAYTAGVLDFLTEALDEWYAAKARNELVPAHDVRIEIFTGASAGGMCAAISAVMLQDEFAHDPQTKGGTTNRLYESWVNRIDIEPLLKIDDLKNPGPVVSLLDSTIIDTIATNALTRGKPTAVPRPYVSPDLALVLSLTNLRGVIYSLNGVAPGSVEETAFFYGDRIRFRTVRADSTPGLNDNAYQLDFAKAGGNWDTLRTAAMATGAFPIFLAPRVLTRCQSDYTPPLWESPPSAAKDDPPPVKPTFPQNLPLCFQTLNVDGGVTNNDPFNYAHDFLVMLAPEAPNQQLESNPCKADRAVLSIAPFPTTANFGVLYDTRSNASVFKALPQLFAALIAQSRFFGESLSNLMRGTTFSHFIVAPAGPQPEALQCATLGAFGGFFEKTFREHDYALGRRNCQKFLRDHFIFPENNLIIREGLESQDPATRAQILARFQHSAPTDPQGRAIVFPGDSGVDAKTRWLPIIPLCHDLSNPITATPGKLSEVRLDHILDLLSTRFREVVWVVRKSLPGRGLRWFLLPGPWFIAFFSRCMVKKALIKALGDSYQARP